MRNTATSVQNVCEKVQGWVEDEACREIAVLWVSD